MSKQVRRRRGTTAEHATFIGAQAEITVDTTKTTAVVHDGLTLGGFPLAKEARLINTATGLLGGGDLTADRTISLNVPGLAEDVDVGLTTDYILTYDVAAAAHKRVLYSGFGVQYLWKACRNETGVQIPKGTPVYITGRNGDAITVGVADAANPAKMPAVGVVTTNLADNTNGIVVTSGFVRGVDAGAGLVGDTLYVAPGGGFTTAKPANPNLIQNVGKIVKEGSNGNLLIFGPGRTNDVPALADGHVFIGNSSGVTTQRALTQADVGMTGNVSFAGVTINEVTANESPFTVSGYSLTGSGAQSMFELSGTWNTTGTPTAIKLNVTDTASNANSLLLDLRVGGSSVFSVTKLGAINLPNGSTTAPSILFPGWGSTYWIYGSGDPGLAMWAGPSSRTSWILGDPGLFLHSGAYLGWSPTSATGARDLRLWRDGVATLAQRNGAVAQTSRIYGTYTDASNYTRLALGHNGTSAFINEEVAGTGTAAGIAVSAASLSGSQATSLLNLTQTWNTTGTPTAIKLNVTDTASNAASLLLDLQRDGVSQCRVSRTGSISSLGVLTLGVNSYVSGSGTRFSFLIAPTVVGALIYQQSVTLPAWMMRSDGRFGWSSTTDPTLAPDTMLYRDAAGIIAQRNAANTQVLRVYNTYTDASNYEAVELSHATYSGGVYSRLRTITAGTGADNINLVLSPSGSGAIVARMPDGTGTGGNARGTYAVDLQAAPSEAAEVASGPYSVVLGGFRNSASGAYAIAGGYNCYATSNGNVAMGYQAASTGTVSIALGFSVAVSGTAGFGAGRDISSAGAYAVATGYYTRTDKHGQQAHGAGRFSSTGDAQRSLLVARNTTTDATLTELFLDGSASRITLPNDTRWFASVRVVASTNTAGAAYAVFERRCLIGRGANAAATAIVGNVQTIGSDIGTSTGSPPAGWAVALSADTTNGALKIEVTGALATTIRWVAEVSLVEVAYA